MDYICIDAWPVASARMIVSSLELKSSWESKNSANSRHATAFHDGKKRKKNRHSTTSIRSEVGGKLVLASCFEKEWKVQAQFMAVSAAKSRGGKKDVKCFIFSPFFYIWGLRHSEHLFSFTKKKKDAKQVNVGPFFTILILDVSFPLPVRFFFFFSLGSSEMKNCKGYHYVLRVKKQIKPYHLFNY